MTSSQNEHIEPDQQTSDNSLNEVNGIYNEESGEFFLNIKNDLNQIDRLVSDAVTNLVINFKFISQLTKSHYEMVMAIEKLAIPNENEHILELLRRQMMIADKIEHELGAVITSLQFGDLVTQLLAHTSSQFDVLIKVLQRIDCQSNLQREDKLTDRDKNISQAMQIVRSRSKKKPVVQRAMRNGEIELF